MNSKYQAAADMTYYLQQAARHSIMIEHAIQHTMPVKELVDMVREDLVKTRDAMVRLNYAREEPHGQK